MHAKPNRPSHISTSILSRYLHYLPTYLHTYLPIFLPYAYPPLSDSLPCIPTHHAKCACAEARASDGGSRLIMSRPPASCIPLFQVVSVLSMGRKTTTWIKMADSSLSYSSFRWTMGSVLFLASWAVLLGPVTYAQHLISGPRLPFTAVYFTTIALTLYFAIGVSYRLRLTSVSFLPRLDLRLGSVHTHYSPTVSLVLGIQMSGLLT